MSSGPEAQLLRSGVPLITSGGRRAALLTTDGIRIAAAYEPAAGARDAPPRGLVTIVAHGFTGSLERPAVRRAAAAFAQHTPVITFSFRGHGSSGGRSTVGEREVLDLAAVVRWARSLGHDRVATVGFSMGGSVVVRHAALYGPRAPLTDPHDPHYAGRMEAHTDAVVAVSAPSRWFYRGTASMRRVHWVITRPMGRVMGRFGLRTRIHSEAWDPVPLSPTEAAPLIAPVPLLIVHGDRDGYFPLDHPRMLAEAADPARTELWLERGFGHAENAAPPELLDRIARWIHHAGHEPGDDPGR